MHACAFREACGFVASDAMSLGLGYGLLDTLSAGHVVSARVLPPFATGGHCEQSSLSTNSHNDKHVHTNTLGSIEDLT